MQHLLSPHMFSEDHEIPMAEPLAVLNHLSLFQLQRCEEDYSHGNQESHFQQFSAFFVSVPVPSSKARCLPAQLPDGVGTALPVQAVLEPIHGTWRGSAFLSHPELSVGVLRLHVGQDIPRKRGCVGFTGGHTEQGHPPQAVQDIQSYCIRRVPSLELCSTPTDIFKGPWLCS